MLGRLTVRDTAGQLLGVTPSGPLGTCAVGAVSSPSLSLQLWGPLSASSPLPGDHEGAHQPWCFGVGDKSQDVSQMGDKSWEATRSIHPPEGLPETAAVGGLWGTVLGKGCGGDAWALPPAPVLTGWVQQSTELCMTVKTGAWGRVPLPGAPGRCGAIGALKPCHESPHRQS